MNCPQVLLAAGLALLPISAQSTDQIGIDLLGTIDTRCEITENVLNNISFDLESVSAIIPFSLYCNVEMSIQLESANGGLLNVAAAERRGHNEELYRRYEATVSVDSLGFTQSIGSSDLVGGATFDLGSDIAFSSNGRVAIALDAPIGEGYSGDYVDEIRISVFPSLAIFN